jgi:hypothetical protein
MPHVSAYTKLTNVEHILGSGTGTLDFAVGGEDEYFTWDGTEEAEWSVEDVEQVDNSSEDRFILYPKEEYFICKIIDDGTEQVHCWCD